MKYRLVLVGIVAAMFAVAWVPMAGQAQQAAGTPAAANWTAPHTPWGDPDLQGIWGGGGRAFLERPEKWRGREFLTEAEATEWEAKLAQRNIAQGQGKQENIGDGNQANYNAIVGWAPGRPRVSRRTSAIIDPPDGLLPPWTLEQVKHWEAREAATLGRGDADWTIDRVAAERCIAEFAVPFVAQWGMGFGEGPPIGHQGRNFEDVENNEEVNPGGDLQSPYASSPGTLRFIQGPGYVAITEVERSREEHRIIPLDGRPHLDKQFRQHLGDSRGHFEGNTLVVETTNLQYVSENILTSHGRGSTYPGTGKTLRITQKYTPISATAMEYTATVDDPAVWTRPWTVAWTMRRDDDHRPAPNACREGIDDIGTTLYGWRLDEEGAMYSNKERRDTRMARFAKVKERAIAAAKQQGR